MTCAAAIAINQLDLEVLRFFFAYKEGGELPREIKGDILHFDYKPRVVRGIQPFTSVDATEAEEKKNVLLYFPAAEHRSEGLRVFHFLTRKTPS